MLQTTRAEFEKRRQYNAPALSDLMDWLAADGHRRTLCRSYGAIQVELIWEDGYLRAVKLNEGHTFRTGADRLLTQSAAAHPLDNGRGPTHDHETQP